MMRFWLNLDTLRYRINDMESGPARTDAENWIGTPLGWFRTIEEMNAYIRAEVLPILERAWKAAPHQRLGQLISNATGGDHDVFYVPDGQLRDGLKGLTE